MSKEVYFDYNATTPLAKEVSEAIINALNNFWANPSSSYSLGVSAKKEIEKAREYVAQMIDAPESNIIFTSGGTESNNLAIYSAIHFYKKNVPYLSDSLPPIPHIITSNIEHDSVAKLIDHMNKEGLITRTIIPVSKETGCVDAHYVIDRVRDETCLITIMAANNETGLMQPIAELGDKIETLNNSRKIPVLFHTDASQVIGKLNIKIPDIKAHFLSIVGHKFYGPRIGALYAAEYKEKSLIYPVFYGGGQERGLRPGTENTPMIIGLGQAAKLVSENIMIYEKHMRSMRDYLETQLLECFGEKVFFNNVRLNAVRLPNTTSVAFLYDDLNSAKILAQCPSYFFASSCSACHNAHNINILLNSGTNEYLASRTIRLSVGRDTTKEDVDMCVKALHTAIFL